MPSIRAAQQTSPMLLALGIGLGLALLPATASLAQPAASNDDAAAAHSNNPDEAAPDGLQGVVEAAPSDDDAHPTARPAPASAEQMEAEHAQQVLKVVGAVALGGAAATVATGAAQLGLFGAATGFSLALGRVLPINFVGAVEWTLLLTGLALTFAPPLTVAAAVTFASWWVDGRFGWTVGAPALVVGALGFPVGVALGAMATFAVVANAGHLLCPPGSIRTGFLEIALVGVGGMVGGLVGSGMFATAAAIAAANAEALGPVIDEWSTSHEE